MIPETAEIPQIAEIWNSAAKCYLKQLHPPSQSIFTWSERRKEDEKIPVFPLVLPPLWEGTIYVQVIGGGKNSKEITPSCHHLKKKA